MNIQALNAEVTRLTKLKSTMVPPKHLDEMEKVEYILSRSRQLCKMMYELKTHGQSFNINDFDVSFLTPNNENYVPAIVNINNIVDIAMERIIESVNYINRVLGQNAAEYIDLINKIENIKRDISRVGISAARINYNFNS